MHWRREVCPSLEEYSANTSQVRSSCWHLLTAFSWSMGHTCCPEESAKYLSGWKFNPVFHLITNSMRWDYFSQSWNPKCTPGPQGSVQGIWVHLWKEGMSYSPEKSRTEVSWQACSWRRRWRCPFPQKGHSTWKAKLHTAAAAASQGGLGATQDSTHRYSCASSLGMHFLIQ